MLSRADHLRHGLRRQLVARRHARSPSAAPTTPCGPSTPRPASRSSIKGAHSDWVLDTVFSTDGTHLVSVSRDMTVKLTEVATQRFVDNITSITPGALKGGMQPSPAIRQRDEIVIGGSDGVPKVYRMLPRDQPRDRRRRQPDPQDAGHAGPHLRAWRSAATASGSPPAAAWTAPGEVHVYGYEFDTKLPDNIKAISGKTVARRTPAEKETPGEVSHRRRQADRQGRTAAERRLRRRVPARRQAGGGRRQRRHGASRSTPRAARS